MLLSGITKLCAEGLIRWTASLSRGTRKQDETEAVGIAVPHRNCLHLLVGMCLICGSHTRHRPQLYACAIYVRATERTVHIHMTTAAVALMLDFVYVCNYMCMYLCMYVITCDFVYVCICMCICVCECCPPLLLLMCLPSCARVTMFGVCFMHVCVSASTLCAVTLPLCVFCSGVHLNCTHFLCTEECSCFLMFLLETVYSLTRTSLLFLFTQ